MANQTLLQNINILSTKLHAVTEKVLDMERKAGEASGNGLSSMREEIKRDVSKERAMMEASMEHRIDQQVGRLLANKDNSAALTRLERRVDDVLERLAKLEQRPETA